MYVKFVHTIHGYMKKVGLCQFSAHMGKHTNLDVPTKRNLALHAHMHNEQASNQISRAPLAITARCFCRPDMADGPGFNRETLQFLLSTDSPERLGVPGAVLSARILRMAQ